MKCRICNQDSSVIFNAVILKKYDIKYYNCSYCGFLQTEEPYWIKEAYAESINLSDTGIMYRNLFLSSISSSILYCFFDRKKSFLDFAGGYGIFTRLMRDIGFDFYWNDKYSQNLIARGFEYKDTDIELITSFESFEHFENPIEEIESMLEISRNILFSTELLPAIVPNPKEWEYYGLGHGQHISFYSMDTLKYIATKYNLNLYTNKYSLHLLTDKKISNLSFQLLLKISRFGFFNIVKKLMKSKINNDWDLLK